jgi:hypothetical protein
MLRRQRNDLLPQWQIERRRSHQQSLDSLRGDRSKCGFNVNFIAGFKEYDALADLAGCSR